MRACVVVGTRPEAIKLKSVVESLDDVFVLFTGQHRNLIDSSLITPDKVLEWEGAKILDFDFREFDVTIVQGDTFSAFSGALSSFFHRVPVAHVEAGLRTKTKFRPFPEEMMRRLIAEIADVHFAPTERAASNLFGRENVFVVGNTVVDAALSIPRTPIAEPFAFATIHRRESWGDPLGKMIVALEQIHRDIVPVWLSVHPSVEKQVRDAHVKLLPPLKYEDAINMIASARVVLTDSGGIQEEAPIFGTPLVVLRDETERMEGVEEAVAFLAGTNNVELIVELTRAALELGGEPCFVYGDGTAGKKIATILTDIYENTTSVTL